MNSTTNSTSTKQTVNPFETVANEYLDAYDKYDPDGRDYVGRFAKKYRLALDSDNGSVLAALLRAVRDGKLLVLDNPGSQDRRQLN